MAAGGKGIVNCCILCRLSHPIFCYFSPIILTPLEREWYSVNDCAIFTRIALCYNNKNNHMYAKIYTPKHPSLFNIHLWPVVTICTIGKKGLFKSFLRFFACLHIKFLTKFFYISIVLIFSKTTIVENFFYYFKNYLLLHTK